MYIGISLAGRLVKDVNVSQKNDGTKRVSFQFAGNSLFKTPVYFIVYVTKEYQQDLVARTLKKGDKVFVKGELDISQFETKDGTKLEYKNIYAEEVYPVGQWVYPDKDGKKPEDKTMAKPTEDDDMPF